MEKYGKIGIFEKYGGKIEKWNNGWQNIRIRKN